jgi:hypothetical protein
MHHFEVGKLLVPGVTRWPPGGEFNWHRGGLELHLRFPDPTAGEVEAVRKGGSEFALMVAGDVLWFLYHFALRGRGVPWSDAPYTWHLLPEALRGLPPARDTGETRAVLETFLVDAGTGILRAMRALSLSPDFTRALYGAIRVQASTPWCGREAYDAQIADAYRRWPTTEAMLAAASHRTVGGA